MLIILYTIKSLFRRFYAQESEEFRNGFERCLYLFELGMSKHPQFNAFVECINKDKEIKELTKQIKEREYKIKNLSIKADAKSINSKGPLDHFREYSISTDGNPEFTIIANLNPETFNNMIFNFACRYTWSDVIECKAKLLQCINSKSTNGYKAYKDEKTAIKENKGIKIKKAFYK